LAKNVRHDQKEPHKNQKVIRASESLFVEGVYDVMQKKWIEFTIGEFIGITKTRLITIMERSSTQLESQGENTPVPLLQQLKETLEKYKKIYNIKSIYGGHFLCQHLDVEEFEIVPLFPREHNWHDFVGKMFLGKEEECIQLDWSCSAHCLSLTICSLVNCLEYLLLD
jgi:hypothetical protein